MRKGFTLLEIMIVIIIVGILATLGMTQYNAAIEKARGAEARSVISQMRSTCGAIYIRDRVTTGCTALTLGIGTANDMIPSACRTTNYFRYGISGTGATGAATYTATRCSTGGKTPNAVSDGTLQLATTYNTGADTWSGAY